MPIHFHAIVIATCLTATVAVGLASAASFSSHEVSLKTDRLPAGVGEVGVEYMTFETRKEGVSVLSRLTLGDNI